MIGHQVTQAGLEPPLSSCLSHRSQPRTFSLSRNCVATLAARTHAVLLSLPRVLTCCWYRWLVSFRVEVGAFTSNLILILSLVIFFLDCLHNYTSKLPKINSPMPISHGPSMLPSLPRFAASVEVSRGPQNTLHTLKATRSIEHQLLRYSFAKFLWQGPNL